MKRGEKFLEIIYSDGSTYEVDVYYIADNYGKYSVKMSKYLSDLEVTYEKYFNAIYVDDERLKRWFTVMDFNEIEDYIVIVSESHSSKVIVELNMINK